MSETIPDKVYFRIGEVGRILGVEPYVIRYWESEFKNLRPRRTRSDQRLYRRSDIEALLTIRDLLYKEKFTIAGAKKQLSLAGGRTGPAATTSESHGNLLKDIRKELRDIRKILG
ncbi:MAG: MerR family transcriptional regulator [Syntrophales bacterium]|nr:MerR family transcriptional regulator [Syntrophales bacterium]MCK9528793.1 MerR family transcriptional regulator [Syntrophales bacterium]MDX9922740.1 MerR family transcriptional regulator [Syntrophales bacterium]